MKKIIMSINNNLKKYIYIYNLFLLLLICLYINEKKIKETKKFTSPRLSNKDDYENKKFVVIERLCPHCGLFSFFIVSLGCRYLVKINSRNKAGNLIFAKKNCPLQIQQYGKN